MAYKDYELLLTVRADLLQAVKGLDSLGKGLNQSGKAADSARASVKKLNDSSNSVGQNLARIAKLIAGAFVVRELVQFTQAAVDVNARFQAIQTTLNQATGSTAKAGDELDYVRGIADKLGVSYQDAAEQYARLLSGAKSSPALAANVRALFEAVETGAQVLGLDASKTATTFDLLRQVAGQGSVTLSQMASQIGKDMPAAWQRFTADIGINTKTQKNWQSLTINSGDAFAYLARAIMETYGGQAAAASQTITAQMQSVKNAFEEAELAAGKSGLIDSVTNALKSLAATLRDPSVLNGLAGLVSGLGTLVDISAKAAAGLVHITEYLADRTAVAMGDYSSENAALLGQELDRLQKLKAEQNKPGLHFDIQIGGTQESLDARIARLKEAIALAQKYGTSTAETKITPATAVAAPLAPVHFLIDPKKQAAQAAALAAAINKIDDQLSALRSEALGPVTAIWEKYNKTVRDATDASNAAVKAGASEVDIHKKLTEELNLAATARDKALAAQHEQLQLALAQGTGDTATAASLQIHQQYDALLADLERAGDTAGVALAKKVINVSAARAQLDQLQQAVETALNNQARAESEIQSEQNAGLITDYTARQKILDLHQQTAAELDKLLPKYKELTATIGDPKAAAALADLEGKLADMTRSTNDLKLAFNSGFEQGLTDALTGLVTQSETVSEAFRQMANAILASLAQVAARAIATRALTAIAGGFSSGGPVRDGHATGGYILGGGTSTSDSIPAWLSNGEFVQRAAAVDFYGVDFMRAINALRFPHFADGGVVSGIAAPAAPRLAGGGAGAARTSAPPVVVRNINVFDSEDAANKIGSTGAFEHAVVNAVMRNGAKIKRGIG